MTIDLTEIPSKEGFYLTKFNNAWYLKADGDWLHDGVKVENPYSGAPFIALVPQYESNITKWNVLRSLDKALNIVDPVEFRREVLAYRNKMLEEDD